MYVTLHIVLKIRHLLFGLAAGDSVTEGAWLSAYCLRNGCLNAERCTCAVSGRLAAGLCRTPRTAADTKDLLEHVGKV